MLQSDEIRKFINEKYTDGSVIPCEIIKIVREQEEWKDTKPKALYFPLPFDH